MTFEQKLFSALHPKRSRVRKHRKGGARRGPWRSEVYRRWIASHACIICGANGTQAAHTQHNGMSSKGSDASCLPMCPAHHDELDGRRKLPNGEIGKEAFIAFHGINLQWRADWFLLAWGGGASGPYDHAQPEHVCSCRFSGDQADVSGCDLHGVSRPPAVRLVMDQGGDTCPF